MLRLPGESLVIQNRVRVLPWPGLPARSPGSVPRIVTPCLLRGPDPDPILDVSPRLSGDWSPGDSGATPQERGATGAGQGLQACVPVPVGICPATGRGPDHWVRAPWHPGVPGSRLQRWIPIISGLTSLLPCTGRLAVGNAGSRAQWRHGRESNPPPRAKGQGPGAYPVTGRDGSPSLHACHPSFLWLSLAPGWIGPARSPRLSPGAGTWMITSSLG